MGLAAIIGGIGAGVGGLAGALGGDDAMVSSVDAGSATDLERMALAAQQRRFGELGGLVDRGPGGEDVSAALGAQRGFAAQLQAASATGGLPQQQDILQAQQLSSQLFAPQQTALNQLFEDQGIQAQRQAAIMGRSGDDPVLQARLAMEQGRQQQLLGAQQTAQSAQIAAALPGQRLSFAGQRAQVLGGLATQALQNRQALTALGGQLAGQERDFRLATATRRQQQERSVGSRIAGGLSGAFGGLTAGLGAGMNYGVGQDIRANIQARTANTQAMTGQRMPAGQQPMGMSIFERFGAGVQPQANQYGGFGAGSYGPADMRPAGGPGAGYRGLWDAITSISLDGRRS